MPVNHARSTNDFENCKYHNCYLLKIYLVKEFPYHHFHESKRNLMTLRFYGVCVLIHVNLSNHNHKTRLVTNPNSYGLNLCNLNLLPPGSTRACHCFQVVLQPIENSKNTYAKPTLIGMGTEYVNTIGYEPQVVC